VSFNPYKKSLSLDEGSVTIQKQELSLLMRMNFSNQQMKWRIDCKSAPVSLLYSILPSSIHEKLKNYQFSEPLMTRVLISGSFAPGSTPAVDIYFKSINNTLSIADRSFDNLKLLGWFTNHMDSTKINDDHNSKVVLPVFTGTVYQFPIDAKVMITDLIEPKLYMNATLTYDETKQGEITSDKFNFLAGLVKVHFVFDAPLVNYVDTINQTVLGNLSGDVMIRDLSMDQVNTGYQFRNINGHLSFNKPDLIIDSVVLTVNNNQAKLSGYATHFVSFLFLPSQMAYVNLEVSADTVNFNSFKKPPAKDESKKYERKKSKKEFSKT